MMRRLLGHSQCLRYQASLRHSHSLPPRRPWAFLPTSAVLCVPTIRVTSFSTEMSSSYPDHLFERVELDRTLPLSASIERLIKIPVGCMHYLDFYNKCPSIMRKSCKMQSGVEDARLLLNRMLQEKQVSGRVVPAKAFEILLFGWTKIAKREPERAVQAMMELIELMGKEDEYDQLNARADSTDSCQPTVQTYNTVLRGMAEAATFLPSAAREAEQLLEVMESRYRERGWHTRPNTRSYTHVITAYGNMRRYESGDRAQAVLDRMLHVSKLELEAYKATYGVPYNTEDLTQNVKRIVLPDLAVYSAVIRAHAKSGAYESANKAYALLTEMTNHVRPDAIAVTATINAFAHIAGKSSGKVRDRILARERAQAAERAESLLMLMEEIAKDESLTASCGGRDETMKEESQMGGELDMDRALEAKEGITSPVEEDLEDDTDYEEDMKDDMDYEEDTVFYEDLDTDGGKEKSPQTTSMRPTVVTYNSCLNAWAQSDTRDAAPRAAALLQRMIESSLNNEDAVQPDQASFNTVLNAWARYSRYDLGAPEKAEELLNLMYDMYYSGRLKAVKPDVYSYTTVINAWARAGERPDKTENARRLLDVMISKYDADELDMKPDVIAYTSVLNAAAHSTPHSTDGDLVEDNPFTSVSAASSEGPYSIALRTYQELQNDPFHLGISPDHFAFAAMLQVIRQHTAKASAERRQMVETVFDEACAAGQVSSFVIRALREACPAIDLLERLLGSQELAKRLLNVSQLPERWSRNVDRSLKMRRVDDKEQSRNNKWKKQRSTDNRREKHKDSN